MREYVVQKYSEKHVTHLDCKAMSLENMPYTTDTTKYHDRLTNDEALIQATKDVAQDNHLPQVQV